MINWLSLLYSFRRDHNLKHNLQREHSFVVYLIFSFQDKEDEDFVRLQWFSKR